MRPTKRQIKEAEDLGLTRKEALKLDDLQLTQTIEVLREKRLSEVALRVVIHPAAPATTPGWITGTVNLEGVILTFLTSEGVIQVEVDPEAT